MGFPAVRNPLPPREPPHLQRQHHHEHLFLAIRHEGLHHRPAGAHQRDDHDHHAATQEGCDVVHDTPPRVVPRHGDGLVHCGLKRERDRLQHHQQRHEVVNLVNLRPVHAQSAQPHDAAERKRNGHNAVHGRQQHLASGQVVGARVDEHVVQHERHPW